MLNKSKLFLIFFCILLAGTFAQQTFSKDEKKTEKAAKVDKTTKVDKSAKVEKSPKVDKSPKVVKTVKSVKGLQSTVPSGKAAKSSKAAKDAAQQVGPIVSRSIKNDTTKIPLRYIRPKAFTPRKQGDIEKMPKSEGKIIDKNAADPLVRPGLVTPNVPPTFQNFEGADNNCGCLPPDTNGDVGPNHYVEIVNSHYQVFDKSGNSLLGPVPINTIFTGFGGFCESLNSGDPVALYDHLADRWLVSQFAIFTGDVTDHECVAISTSGDPTGTWHRYDFPIGPADILPDYPKFGVWPDAYYMSTNQFTQDLSEWRGQGAVAFERDQMLIGAPAQQIYFSLFAVNPNFGGAQPSDLDGPVPPVGAPNVFMEMDDEVVFGTDRLSLWDFHVDWTTPANSTFGVGGNPNQTIDVAPFDWNLCGSPFGDNCIDQPGTGQGLDGISDRIMFRVQYRNFGTHSTLVTNHTVDVGGDQAGIRWYELRKTPPLGGGGGWSIFQQGTYAPDSDHRWMGSAAMDSAGNIAIGFSVSSSSVFPSIRYAARLAGDPLGELSQGEAEIIAGTGVQTHGLGRWGDYSGLMVDPSAGSQGGVDCDFWYTTEYIQTTSSASWQTRVGAFTFAPAACGGGATGTLNGTVTDSATTNPIAGATVQVVPGGLTTTTDVNGFYQFTLGVGTYDVTASASGYVSETATGVVVTDGGTTTQDFQLDPATGACVYENDFNDGVLEWLEEKPTVTESGGFLNLTPLKRKAIAVADAAFGAQSVGTYTYVVNFTGGTFSKNWLYISRVDKKNQLEVLAKVDTGKLVVKDRNFAVAAKAKADFTWVPGTTYTIVINYDGTNVDVSIDGTPLIVDFVPSRSLPVANTGAAAKLNSMSIDSFCFE